MGYWEGDTYIPSDYEKAQQSQMSNDLSSALSGPGNKLTITGSPQQQQGALQGLQFGQMLYGQGIADVGQQSKQYSDLVQGRLGANYAKADIARQAGAQRIGQANVRAGLGGIDTAGTSEQANRQSDMEAAGMNQDYGDKALALYGRNISAKQQGLAGQYMAGAGIGQAATPAPIPNYNSGCPMCIVATQLFLNKEISKNDLLNIMKAGRSFDRESYIGYILLAQCFLNTKSKILKNKIIPAFISFSVGKPNLLAKIMMLSSKIVGKIYLLTSLNIHNKLLKKATVNDVLMRRKIKC